MASRFERQLELRSYLPMLREAGVVCTASWVTDHDDLDFREPTQEEWDTEGDENYADIDRADAIILFTQATDLDVVPKSWARGGMYVEFGYARGTGKVLYVVGPRTNIFTHHSSVMQFDTVEDLCRELSE